MTKWMSIAACLSVVLGSIVGCAGDPEPGGGGEDGGEVYTQSAWPDGAEFTDDEIGLAEGTVFDSPTPPAVVMETAEPGERDLLIRAYDTSPPRIPHTVEDMVIDRGENTCAECHDSTGKDGKATPPSHMTPDGALLGKRYACTLCHVPQTDARPLVGNRFPD